MPELPEVENTRRYLEEVGLPGLAFTGAQVGWAKSLRSPPLEDFVLGLIGRRVARVGRRGKYLLLPLDGGETFILHLGMTGGLRVHPSSQTAPPMARHTFPLDDGRELRFLDGRKFGKLWLTSDTREVLPALGPEPLEAGFTADALGEILKDRKVPIKALLLEQSVVAGLGNLYVDEALYLAGIHPSRLAGELSDAEVSTLRDCIVAALTSALDQYDRSRVDQWPDPPFGLSTWSLPRKSGDPCGRCAAPISGMRVRGRGTYFCPQCQPELRA